MELAGELRNVLGTLLQQVRLKICGKLASPEQPRKSNETPWSRVELAGDHVLVETCAHTLPLVHLAHRVPVDEAVPGAQMGTQQAQAALGIPQLLAPMAARGAWLL